MVTYGVGAVCPEVNEVILVQLLDGLIHSARREAP